MDLIESIKVYVRNSFEQSKNGQLPYHNWKHSENVFNATTLIAGNVNITLSDDEMEQLKIAALFHDMGYLESSVDHEERSAVIAEKFLKEKNYPSNSIEEVKRFIRATKLKHTPKDDLERIIMDADLSHLGRKNYLQTTYKYLKDEISDAQKESLTDKDWAESCFSFLKAHEFMTDYAKKHFGATKRKNMEDLKTIVNESREDKSLVEKKKKKAKPDKEVQGNPLKGVETMFRIALKNHVSLSAIADNKANTLISVNAIIISIVLSALFPKLDSNPYLFYPSVTILIGSFITIILAILSTIPNVTRGEVNKEEVNEKKGNLLFFGNFHKMKLEDFEWSMSQLMESKDYIYSSMSRDLFFLGKVLNKKYMLLRYAYFAFMLGLFSSIVVFVLNVIPFLGTNN